MSKLPTKGNTSTYTFASQPRAVASQRKKYRDPALSDTQGSLSQTYGNMMYDPRIVRGSTWRSQSIRSQQDPVELQKQQETQRRRAAKKRATQKSRPKSPEAVPGRKHIDVQTEVYLEELTDRVEEQDVQVQTDPFLDRPPSPLFIPMKSGVDKETQIEDGELFDFDLEVKPILQVLVGKTMEQALMEVMEEEELSRLRDHQREFEELRNAELLEVQRLEEESRRHNEEKERRMKQEKEALEDEKATADKVAARAFAQNYLAELVPSVFGSLNEGGYFYDPQEREVESVFMPWLMDGVEERLNQTSQARSFLDDIIRDVVNTRRAAYGLPLATQDPADKDDGEEEKKEADDELVAADESNKRSDESPVDESTAEPKIEESEASDTSKTEGEPGDGGSKDDDDDRMGEDSAPEPTEENSATANSEAEDPEPAVEKDDKQEPSQPEEGAEEAES